MSLLGAPSHVLSDWQVEYNGLVMGAGTDFELPPGLNVLDLAPVRTMDVQKLWGDGDYSGPDFADIGAVSIPVEIYGGTATQFAENVKAFRHTFGVQASPQPLWVKLPGQPLYGVGAKVSARNVNIDVTWGTFATAAVQLRVTQPPWQEPTQSLLFQAGDEKLLIPGGYVSTGALQFVLFETTGILNFGTPTQGVPVLLEPGNAACYPLVVCYGPCDWFNVIVDNSYLVEFDGAVPAGSVCVIDYSTGTATLDGADATAQLGAYEFTPVSNGTLVTTNSDNTAAQIVVSWANMWDGSPQ